jgi:signal transduction histidine kinase
VVTGVRASTTSAADASAPQAAAPGSTRVLVVEDNPGDADLVRIALSEVDGGAFDVTEAATLREALAHVRGSVPPHVILLDLTLPDASGLDALHSLTAAVPEVPVLVLTGSDGRLGGAALQAGAQDYLLKGDVDAALLSRAVRYAIERHEHAARARLLAAERAARAEAEAARERLAEADRRKDEFLGMLSHELRNPLAPIRNSIYILGRADPAGEQARRARAVLERQTDHLTRIVDDLLDVTRIARGKIFLRRDRVDVVALVRATADDFRSIAVERGLKLGVEVPETSVSIDADATRIAQVIGNLVQNAAKFTPSGGRVTLSARVVGAFAELRVRDTGVGIEPALLGRVFEPFVQCEDTLARTQGGLGLGLALVKGIAELHGGSVRAESAGAGQGAEFVVTLPLAGAEVVTTASPGQTVARHVPRRVLIVDDNHDAADSLAELVELFGHAVEVAHDGIAAVEKARAIRPDVVLCDIGLPGMDGYQVARRLRALGGPEVQLIAISGYAQPEDLDRAEKAGFDAHVAKPADPANIRRLLDAARRR